MKDKNQIHQVHDKFFKLTFTDEGVKESFLQTYLPPKLMNYLDLSTVEEVTPSFINENFRLEESDLLMKVKAKALTKETIYILALMEHKSYRDRKTAFQILKYLVDIWQNQLDKQEKLMPIIPIIIYEGKKKWNYWQLSDYFKTINPDLQQFLPTYNSLFFDFSLENKLEKLPENIVLRTYIELINIVYSKNQKQFIEKTIELIELVYNANGEENIEQFIKVFKRVLTYIENIRTEFADKNSNLTFLDILEGEKPMIVSSFDKWEAQIKEEAIRLGEERGIRLGEERGIRQNARRMKMDQMPVEMIMKYTGLSQKEIEEL